MEQPCYKCRQIVSEGIPFCPHCGAPQIRVAIADSALTPATAGFPGAAAAPAAPAISLPTSWSMYAQPCALAAFFAAVVMVLKLVVPVIAVFGAGFLAVSLYRRRAPEHTIQAKAGARIGAVCGLFCFGFATVLGSLRIAVLHEGGEVRQTLLEGVQQAAARYPDPQMQPTLEFLRSPAGLVMMMVFLLIFTLLFFLILGSLGGMLGGATLGRGDKA
jgi:hypothetical protein